MSVNIRHGKVVEDRKEAALDFVWCIAHERSFLEFIMTDRGHFATSVEDSGIES